MLTWFAELDRILRGKATALPALKEGLIHIASGGLSVVLVMLAAGYGLCMGFYGLLNRSDWSGWKQMGAGTVKFPALFILTLLVTFPSLYVFNALVGSQLSLRSLGRLMVATMSVLVAVLASFGPIVAFFSVTTSSYPFMVLLNVAFCALAGFLGMGFLLQTLHRLSLVMDAAGRDQGGPPAPPAAPAPVGPPAEPPPVMGPNEGPSIPRTTPPPIPIGWGAAEGRVRRSLAGNVIPPSGGEGALDSMSNSPYSRHVKTVFRFWIILFGLVGAQMSWVLRPFIGSPAGHFVLFAQRHSNFFEAVWRTFLALMGFHS